MNIKKYSVLTPLLLAFTFCTPVAPPEPVGPTPSEEQMMWHEMEMNAFIHFTINTFTDKEWGFGDESPELFDPTELDVEQWVSVLKDAGFKGVILTAKHHDGFCLWPSEYTDHDIENSPWKGGKGDLVRDLSEACRAQGLKFGIYVSPWDRNRADYGEESYITYYRNQLEELFTGYGDVFEMWFDGANGGDGYYGGANETRTIDRENYYDWPGTLDLVRSMQQDVLFFSDGGPDLRWGGNEHARAGFTNWNTITTDTLFAGKSGIFELLNTGSEDGESWVPLEANTSIRPGWFYHADEDSLVKTPEELFNTYLTSVGRGSTLLLNVPPDQRGLIHENDIASLKGFRELLDKRFAEDLVTEAVVEASNVRGNSNQYSAENLIDGDKESYWATDDGVTTASLEFDFREEKEINYLVLQEYIQLGQRVRSFTVDGWMNDEWEEISAATTIGYKRILELDSKKVQKIRINITDSKASPVLSSVQVF
jgi:alpha-L-fucosidase